MNAQTERPGAGRRLEPEEPACSSDPSPPKGHPSEALHEAAQRFAEVREFAAYYLSARLDALKLTAVRIGIYAALGVVGLLVGGAVLVVAVVLLLNGIAGAWAQLFPRFGWLGDLITGVIFLAIPAVGIWIGLKWMRARSYRTTVQKYEKRQREQRERFGRDVGVDAATARRSARQTH